MNFWSAALHVLEVGISTMPLMRGHRERANAILAIAICIFLLTLQQQYLNILCVSIQRYNSLGFKKVRSGSKSN